MGVGEVAGRGSVFIFCFSMLMMALPSLIVVLLAAQLRGEAGKRQVKDAKLGLQHNLGLGGAAVVTLYRKA